MNSGVFVAGLTRLKTVGPVYTLRIIHLSTPTLRMYTGHPTSAVEKLQHILHIMERQAPPSSAHFLAIHFLGQIFVALSALFEIPLQMETNTTDHSVQVCGYNASKLTNSQAAKSFVKAQSVLSFGSTHSYSAQKALEGENNRMILDNFGWRVEERKQHQLEIDGKPEDIRGIRGSIEHIRNRSVSCFWFSLYIDVSFGEIPNEILFVLAIAVCVALW